MVRHPPDILITTPESLYLMLTSQAREIFRGTEWVIVDEIHAVAQTKRGAHLALTLERLAEQAERDVQRIGLSATQNPLEEVGRFLVGPKRTCTVIDTGVRKPLDLKIHVPVESMVEPDQGTNGAELDPFAGGEATRKSIWPAIYPEILQLVRRAPLDDRVRQQPPRGGAARAAAERARRGGDRPRAPRLAGARGAADRRGPAEGRRAAVPGGDLVAGARHRHGRRRPRAPGRVAEVGHRRPPAHRPRRPQRRRDLEGPHLPQVPRRPARVRGRRAAHARGADRDDRRPAQPARRARPADRRDRGVGRDRRGRRAARADPAHLHLRRALARAARERARHARRPLPVGGVRRAAPAHRVGPRRRHDPRPQGLAGAGDHQRRHDPRPRPVLGQPARRPPRRRARRGDGLRGAARPGLPARRHLVADRGDHPRPRRRHARARRPRRRAVLEGRLGRAPARARRGDRRVLPLGRRPGLRDARARLRPRREGGRQPARVPARAGGGDARHPERAHDRRRALPRRDRRLAPVHPLPLRRPRARGLGAGAERPHPRASTGSSPTPSGPTTASSSTSPTPTSRPAPSSC